MKGTPTLHVLCIFDTYFSSWIFYYWADELNQTWQIREPSKMCSTGGSPGLGLGTQLRDIPDPLTAVPCRPVARRWSAAHRSIRRWERSACRRPPLSMTCWASPWPGGGSTPCCQRWDESAQICIDPCFAKRSKWPGFYVLASFSFYVISRVFSLSISLSSSPSCMGAYFPFLLRPVLQVVSVVEPLCDGERLLRDVLRWIWI